MVGFLLRISFGLSLIFVGMTHYMQFGSFQVMVSDGLGPLSVLGMLWAYVYPALLIIGGAFFVIGMAPMIAATCAGLALASVPAGMLLKPVLSGIGLSDAMPPAINAFIWLLVLVFVVKHASCGSCMKGGCGCGDKKCM